MIGAKPAHLREPLPWPLPWRQGGVVHLITTTAVQSACGDTTGAISTHRGSVTCPACLRASDERPTPPAAS